MAGKLYIASRNGGDFYELLNNGSARFELTGNADSAFAAAQPGDAVMVTADDFPKPAALPESWRAAADKGVRLFIECPENCSGVNFTGDLRHAEFERTVVVGNNIPGLDDGTIILQHGCCFRGVDRTGEVWLAAAKVAGYRRAVFGVDGDTTPLLFIHPDCPNVLIANSRISNFITARFAPQCDWLKVLRAILGFLMPGWKNTEWRYQMAVRPYFTDGAPITAKEERAALDRNIKFINDQILTRIHATGMGVAEGFSSEIGFDGSQLRRTLNRSDCSGEIALTLALAGKLTGNIFLFDYAGMILDMMFKPLHRFTEKNSPLYGQFRFYENDMACYGSGNARSSMSALLSGALLNRADWDRDSLLNLISSWRLTGKNGFRQPRFDDPASFKKHDAAWYRAEDFVHLSPHYQASHLAGFLAGWKLTGFEGFLNHARKAAGLLMASYPKLRWTNGQSQEVARLVMYLAWLVRADDTPVHREYLNRVLTDVRRLMQPCGAVAEEMGDLSMGDFPSPQSNAAYGTTEAALIQNNGDPACDLLYTANYLLIGLHEAAFALPDSDCAELAGRLCRFICRIQVRSSARPELDGAWMRGFDWQLWDFFGSSADVGWGAWSIESGWTNSWITITLALRQMKKSLWELFETGKLKHMLPEIKAELELP
ncbi:MAG: hypothetical protein PHI85_00675 [Victivallaceae bacterium]|nr:hypothetical protein [Victivallaceae bacterium]